MPVLSKLPALLVCWLPLVVGCANHAADVSGSAIAVDDGARVGRAVGRLTASLDGRAVRYAISNSPTPAAYGWPDGRLLLTRGLVRLLDDDELAAAVAHELGHLLDDGHLHEAAPAAALGGVGVDAEARADAAGVRLLGGAGLPADAMPRMLEKVARADGTSDGSARRLMERVLRLREAAPRGSPIR